MTQLTLELDKKTTGKLRAAGKHAEILEKFRKIALKVPYDEVTIDDVRDLAEMLGVVLTESCNNWLGSVFNDGNWVCVGFRPSSHVGSHGRIIRIWSRRRK